MDTEHWLAQAKQAQRRGRKGGHLVTITLNRNEQGFGFLKVHGVDQPRPFGHSKEKAMQLFSEIYDQLLEDDDEDGDQQ